MLLTTLILTFLSIFSIEIQSNLKTTAFYENSFNLVFVGVCLKENCLHFMQSLYA